MCVFRGRAGKECEVFLGARLSRTLINRSRSLDNKDILIRLSNIKYLLFKLSLIDFARN